MSQDSPQEIVEKIVCSIDCKQAAVRAVRFNVDGNYCLTCGSDKSLKLWNPHKGIQLKTYSGHGYEVLDAASSCDNSQLCSCGLDKHVILWEVSTGKLLRKFRGHVGTVNCVCFNEEGTVIMSGSIDGSVRLWDCKSRKNDPIQVLDEAKDSVTSIHVTDHEILTGSGDGRVRRYDLRMGQLHADFIGKPVASIGLSRDAQCILVGTMDSNVKLMDKNTGELLNEYTGHQNTDYKVDSVISCSDTHILSGSEDGYVYIWDLVEGKVVGKLAHSGHRVIHSLSYHPTETCLLTACGASVYVWRSKHGRELT